MAGTTGLEPATSAVTGQRSNQLSYVPKSKLLVFERLPAEQALQPSVSGEFSSGILPLTLPPELSQPRHFPALAT